MDANGYVTDYDVTPGGLVSTGNYDSTDAYSGMFLVAVDSISDASPDATRLRATRTQSRARGRSAIRSTQRADGLTGAKPDWMVAYLMNEAEAYAGLRARRATRPHAGRPHPGPQRGRRGRLARRPASTRLWNASAGAFDWAVHPSGDHVTTNWSQLYPDALEPAVGRRVRARPRSARRRPSRPVSRGPIRAPPTPPPPTSSTAPSDPGATGPAPASRSRPSTRAPPPASSPGTRAAAAVSGRAWPYSVQTAAESIQLAAATR